MCVYYEKVVLNVGNRIRNRFQILCARDQSQTQPEQSESRFLALFMNKEFERAAELQNNIIYCSLKETKREREGERGRGGESLKNRQVAS